MNWFDILKSKERFVRENPTITFKLSFHVKERLAKRMGWKFKDTKRIIPNNEIYMSLTEGQVKGARGGWKVLISGWGWFVIKNVGSRNNPKWLAVTFYREE